ncbi:GGDEF and EAL domain-containing protein, partial [Kineosporia mesophila]
VEQPKLLTPPMAVANPLRDPVSHAQECGFDTLAFGAGRHPDPRAGSGIPWPRSAAHPAGPEDRRADDEDSDTAEWELPAPMAIDLSDGPKLIRHPQPPEPSKEPSKEPAEDLRVLTRTTFDPAPEPVVPPAAVLPTEPRRMPEALLTLVLSLIATATAWAVAAPPPVWLTLSVLPLAGLMALLLPGFTAARLLRATALLGAAAALPVLQPALTPVSLVIALTTVASYPLLVGPVAGWTVTALGVTALSGALTGRTLIDGPARIARLLANPQDHPVVGIQIALGSGVLVAALVGITSTAARRRLTRAASAARAGERQAWARTAALAASSSLDPATGLPNRDGLLRALELSLAPPDRRPVGLVLAEVDRFDDLADSLGASTADELAEQVGARIAGHFPGYLVARVSRAQFAVVLTENLLPPNADTCADVARVISRRLDEPVLAGAREFSLTCSLGGAVSGPDPITSPGPIAAGGLTTTPGLTTADDLLQAADEAVRTARGRGRGRWAMFDTALRAQSQVRAGLEQELRHAVRMGLIEIDFQPMLALGSGVDDDDRIAGAQALPRWRRQDGVTVTASTFVPLADDLGLGVTLGLQTINRALAALVIWRHEGVGVDQIWVNLSPAQLEDPDFAHEVAAQLAIRGLAASSLVLQVSAGELVESEAALRTLGLLRSLRIFVALGDFGCGGTSLTMLRRLPISAVKLDGRLAPDLNEFGEGDDVPRAAARLCHSLGLQVICESVQTAQQLEGARQIGADAVQGSAIARPMSAQDVTNLLTLRMPRELRLRSEKQ